jgi:hypothetical protein
MLCLLFTEIKKDGNFMFTLVVSKEKQKKTRQNTREKMVEREKKLL